jgi:hypothetical protein
MATGTVRVASAAHSPVPVPAPGASGPDTACGAASGGDSAGVA